MCSTIIRYLLFIILIGHKISKIRSCEMSIQRNIKEGNIGDVSLFPWLGVFRVHIHEKESLKIALTGIVLIKRNYCISNADDISKIPGSLIKREGRAMFILKDNSTWSCGVLGFNIHPEYDYATFNTIALLELAEEYNYDLKPVCLAKYGYNTSNEIYAVGYTDENRFLEKIIYKTEYVSESLCQEFYNRIGNLDKLYVPTHYFCAFAKNNKKNCVWENGMVLVSNSTGPWALVGFSIKGPGCAAPSRFINIAFYLPWIKSSTNIVDY